MEISKKYFLLKNQICKHKQKQIG